MYGVGRAATQAITGGFFDVLPSCAPTLVGALSFRQKGVNGMAKPSSWDPEEDAILVATTGMPWELTNTWLQSWGKESREKRAIENRRATLRKHLGSEGSGREARLRRTEFRKELKQLEVELIEMVRSVRATLILVDEAEADDINHFDGAGVR